MKPVFHPQLIKLAYCYLNINLYFYSSEKLLLTKAYLKTDDSCFENNTYICFPIRMCGMGSPFCKISLIVLKGPHDLRKRSDWFCCMQDSLREAEIVEIKRPDFHSHSWLLASESFHMGHAQSCETNRVGRKHLSLCSHLKFKCFSFCKISYSETNQTSFLSHVHISRQSKIFAEWPPHCLSSLRQNRQRYYSQSKIYRASD